jgi:hypothetical protein
MRCPNCAASIADGATWCPQCFERFEQEPPRVETTAEPPAFVHPETYRAPPSAGWSRWKAGETTFGPLGRIVASLALLIPFYFFFNAGILGIVGVAMWLFIVMPMALRSIWKRTRIIPPEDDQPSRRAGG